MASVTRLHKALTQQDFHQAIGARSGAWYAACLKITGSDSMAQDAVQEALVSAWSKRHQFHGDSRLETWIHRIAVNCALGALRRLKPTDPWQHEHLVDQSPSPADERHADELGRDLESALGALSELERVCFVLKHLEQWRLAEIASHLDVKVDAVKQALVRALRKLRTKMAHLKAG